MLLTGVCRNTSHQFELCVNTRASNRERETERFQLINSCAKCHFTFGRFSHFPIDSLRQQIEFRIQIFVSISIDDWVVAAIECASMTTTIHAMWTFCNIFDWTVRVRLLIFWNENFETDIDWSGPRFNLISESIQIESPLIPSWTEMATECQSTREMLLSEKIFNQFMHCMDVAVISKEYLDVRWIRVHFNWVSLWYRQTNQIVCITHRTCLTECLWRFELEICGFSFVYSVESSHFIETEILTCQLQWQRLMRAVISCTHGKDVMHPQNFKRNIFFESIFRCGQESNRCKWRPFRSLAFIPYCTHWNNFAECFRLRFRSE